VLIRLTRKRFVRAGRWLGLALLVAQLGAEVHLYSHALTDASDELGAALSCRTCLASSQLQNAVGTAPPAMPVRSIAWTTIVRETAVPGERSELFLAFRSRAPPALA
jgi:hypothetical protein